jgi:hypothetical protein
VHDVDSFQDKSGREVRVNDFVVYGHALGRCAALRFGMVLSIKRGKRHEYSRDDEWAIRVQGIDDDAVDIYGLALCKVAGTLMFPDRILNANAFIPQQYKALFENKENPQ